MSVRQWPRRVLHALGHFVLWFFTYGRKIRCPRCAETVTAFDPDGRVACRSCGLRFRTGEVVE